MHVFVFSLVATLGSAPVRPLGRVELSSVTRHASRQGEERPESHLRSTGEGPDRGGRATWSGGSGGGARCMCVWRWVHTRGGR